MIVGNKKLSKAERDDIAETREAAKDISETATENVTLKAYLTGEVISLKEVGDGVFSEGIMGEGLAIRPENNILYAPVDATVTVLMEDSCHAVGLTMDNGMEILLHVGIDTVDMQGDGFTYLVTENQKVKTGDPLIRFDREKIKKAGHPDVTVCVITETGNTSPLIFHTGIHAEAGKTEIGGQ